MRNRRLQLPMQIRLAPISTPSPEADDAAARTVEVVWSTGARVRRDSFWDGPYYEELDMSPGAVDLGRLNGGAPVLDAHRAYSLSGIIGVVERAWLENGEGRAVLRFSDRDDVTPIWDDVRAGIIRNVSVGYEVRRFEQSESDDGIPIFRATDWAPVEISLVPIGADPRAGTRGGVEPLFPCELVRGDARGESRMDSVEETAAVAEEDGTEATTLAPAAAADNAPATDNAAAIAGERRRIAGINALARQIKADPAVVEQLIAAGASVEAARKRFWDDIVARAAPHERLPFPLAQATGHDAVAFRRQHIVDAMLNRCARTPSRSRTAAGSIAACACSTLPAIASRRPACPPAG
ncbi:MAG: hypothetical protein U1E43_07640 [Rhodospirillales bacterium]